MAALESAMAALGCASLPRGAGSAGSAASAGSAGDANDASATAPASTREAAAPKPPAAVESGAPRTIGEPPTDGVSTLQIPAPRRRSIAVAGGGPSVDIGSRAIVTMTIRGGSVDDRRVLASAAKLVRACADQGDGAAASAELRVELTPDGPARRIVARAGSEPELAACLERTIHRSQFHGDARGREVSVEVVVDAYEEP